MAQLLRITVDGSEDSTCIEIEASNSDVNMLIDVARKLNEARGGGLAPLISIARRREIQEVRQVWDKMVGDDVP